MFEDITYKKWGVLASFASPLVTILSIFHSAYISTKKNRLNGYLHFGVRITFLKKKRRKKCQQGNIMTRNGFVVL